MTLPAVTVPGSAPPFQAAGHSIDQGDVYSNVSRTMGSNRKRRVFTTQNRLVSVQWFLEPPVMAAIWQWFETGLDVGSRAFAAPVANEGAGIQWWTAKWHAPFTVEPVDVGHPADLFHRDAWRVTGVLVLSGEGQDTYTAAADLETEIVVELNATASVVGAFDLATEIDVDLGLGFALQAEVTISLVATGTVIGPADLAAEVDTALDASAAIGTGSSLTDILATQIFGGG